MNIHHLALRTHDLAALERFYVAVIGLAVIRRAERSVWLGAGAAIVMLEPRDDDAREPAIDRRSMELVCFSIDPKDYAAIVERLETASTSIEGRTSCSIYFRDPDGRRVGVSSYPAPLPM